MPIPDFSPAADCVSCGLCLPHCPTYRELPVEMASPRGRIQLMKGLDDGTLEPSPALEEHLGLCLGCRACETACPSGVGFGRLLESARYRLSQAPARRADLLERAGALATRLLFCSPRALGLVSGLLGLYQRSPLRALLRSHAAARLLPARLLELERMAPEVDPWTAVRAFEREYAPYGSERGRVGFLTGCVMPYGLRETHEASIEVLRRNGFRVIVPRGQVCCGALHLHAGDLEAARWLARKNVECFERLELDWLATNSAGCGSALHEYGELLEGDERWRTRALSLAQSVRDIQVLLAERGLVPPALPVELRAVYDDPCHLQHGQGVTREPRQLLESIPGLELVEAPEASWCCGSAGIYSVTHTEMSLDILKRKTENLLSVRPEVVVSANPGCIFQLRFGLKQAGSPVPVLHVMDLLARAYGRDAGGGSGPAPSTSQHAGRR